MLKEDIVLICGSSEDEGDEKEEKIITSDVWIPELGLDQADLAI